jgi:hypothetical protein
MSRRSCLELGLCQVGAALAFDTPCPEPCAECDLRVTPVVVEGATVAVEVSQRVHAAGTGYPFAPGAIERYVRRRDRVQRAGGAALVLIAMVVLSALGGLLAGIARAKGWL